MNKNILYCLFYIGFGIIIGSLLIEIGIKYLSIIGAIIIFLTILIGNILADFGSEAGHLKV